MYDIIAQICCAREGGGRGKKREGRGRGRGRGERREGRGEGGKRRGGTYCSFADAICNIKEIS